MAGWHLVCRFHPYPAVWSGREYRSVSRKLPAPTPPHPQGFDRKSASQWRQSQYPAVVRGRLSLELVGVPAGGAGLQHPDSQLFQLAEPDFAGLPMPAVLHRAAPAGRRLSRRCIRYDFRDPGRSLPGRIRFGFRAVRGCIGFNQEIGRRFKSRLIESRHPPGWYL